MIKVLEPVGATLESMHQLGDKVEGWYGEQDIDMSTIRPVILPRSAYVLGDTLSRRWNIQAINILSAAVEKIEDPETDEVGFHNGQFPVEDQVKDQHILVIDSVCRSGSTLEYCRDAFENLGALTVTTAVLYTKILDNGPDAYRPDLWVADRSSEFVIFTWEMDEFMPVPTEQPTHDIIVVQ